MNYIIISLYLIYELSNIQFIIDYFHKKYTIIVYFLFYNNIIMLNIYDSEIWKWLEKETIDNILKNSPVEKYKSQEIILIEWEENNSKRYIIKYWEVLVKKWDKQLAILPEWEIFGEIWLLTEDPRNATIIANIDTEVIIISQEILLEIINNWDYDMNKSIIKRIEENLKYVF